MPAYERHPIDFPPSRSQGFAQLSRQSEGQDRIGLSVTDDTRHRRDSGSTNGDGLAPEHGATEQDEARYLQLRFEDGLETGDGTLGETAEDNSFRPNCEMPASFRNQCGNLRNGFIKARSQSGCKRVERA